MFSHYQQTFACASSRRQAASSHQRSPLLTLQPAPDARTDSSSTATMGFEIETIKAGCGCCSRLELCMGIAARLTLSLSLSLSDGTNFPQPGNTVKVHYVGTLTNGSKFDSSRDRGRPFEFQVRSSCARARATEGDRLSHARARCICEQLGAGQVIRGWDEGVAKVCGGWVHVADWMNGAMAAD